MASILLYPLFVISSIAHIFSSQPNQPTITNEFEKLLLQKEEAVFTDLARFGICRDKINSLYLKELPTYKTRLPTRLNNIPQETICLIRKVMSDFDIDPATISIVEENHFSPSAAHDLTLFIDIKKFNSLSKSAQIFCIGHEIQHMIYRDNSFIFFLEKTITKANLPAHILSPYRRFAEMRADIKAAIRSKEYATGFTAFLTEWMPHAGCPSEGISHPSMNDRLKLANEILSSFT